tara:strand:+ start:1960 stop:2157 length:198 start_codon:yes stop_codon:yes gene_type:complete
MSKFGLYTKNATESSQQINVVDIPTKSQAEAYFAGVKQLSLEQFQDLFIVKEIKTSDKQLLYGNK